MSMLSFECEEDRATAIEIEAKVIQQTGWKPPRPCLSTSIPAELVDYVKKELDAEGVKYQELP